ncbi:hypodermin-A-like [Prorops nasuta]|uniref:hypodermin-A-like n=1 Tax=Prorops nasuta TaxID=863751 RepID=UPI0034CE5607
MFNNFAIFFVALSVALFGVLAIEFKGPSFGEIANANEAPYMAAIILNDKFHCNAVIISKDFVMTSAACVLHIKDNLDNIKVRVGSVKLSHGGEIHAVQAYYIHNISRTQADPGILYTLGALKLKTPIDINSSQKPIQFSKAPEGLYKDLVARIFYENWHGQLFGWGIDANSNSEATLRKAEIIIERVPHCRAMIIEAGLPYYDHYFCAYGKDGLIGNNGGVVVLDNNPIGMAIYSNLPITNTLGATKDGNVFIYVDKLKGFIDQMLKNP